MSDPGLTVSTCAGCGTCLAPGAFIDICEACAAARAAERRTSPTPKAPAGATPQHVTLEEARANTAAMMAASGSERADRAADRIWEQARAWAALAGVPAGPWDADTAVAFCWLLLKELRPDASFDRAWDDEDRPTMSWLQTRLRAVDRGHLLAQWPEPFVRLKVERKAWWRRFTRMYVKHSAGMAADALELPEVIRLLGFLADPPATHVRDAAWLVACDPRVVDERGRRMPWTFWASLEADNIHRFGDGHVEVTGASYGQQRVVHVPAGWAADALWAAVQTRQPPYTSDQGYVLDAAGVPLLRRSDYHGPLWTRTDNAAAADSCVPLVHPEKVARQLLTGRALRSTEEVDAARTPLGRGHLLTVPPDELEQLARRVGGPSWTAIQDAAWLASAFWMFARGMEILDRRWEHAMVSPEGVRWYLTRKGDPTGRTPWYGVRHIRFAVLDPAGLLARHRQVLAHRRRRAGLPTGPQDLAAIPLFPKADDLTAPVESTHPLNRRLKDYAKAAGLPQQRVSTHSLRAGAATSAGQLGIPQQEIMSSGGWADPEVAQHYHRAALPLAARSAAVQMAEKAGLSAPAEDTFLARVDEAIAAIAARYPPCSCDVCVSDAQRVLLDAETNDRQPRRTR